jgi:hypothetical protein
MKLNAHLQAHLERLRADPLLAEILRSVERTRIRPFIPNTDRDKATDGLIYASGKVAGEKHVLIEILGYDPDDRHE